VFRITLRRKRTIEEKISTIISAANEGDALAAATHLIDGNKLDWQYDKTLETSEVVKEVKPK
jgi:hypothetical protein